LCVLWLRLLRARSVVHVQTTHGATVFVPVGWAHCVASITEHPCGACLGTCTPAPFPPTTDGVVFCGCVCCLHAVFGALLPVLRHAKALLYWALQGPPDTLQEEARSDLRTWLNTTSPADDSTIAALRDRCGAPISATLGDADLEALLARAAREFEAEMDVE
jgi:hypothetical protein